MCRAGWLCRSRDRRGTRADDDSCPPHSVLATDDAGLEPSIQEARQTPAPSGGRDCRCHGQHSIHGL